MKFVDFLIFIGGMIAMIAVVFVGITFILQQTIPHGVSVADRTFIQALVNILLGTMIILFGGKLFNNAVEAIKLGRKNKCLEQEMVS